MTSAEHRSHAQPDPRRPFASPILLTRIARLLELKAASRLLEVAQHDTSAGLYLAQEIGCDASVVVADAGSAALVRERAQSAGVSGRVEVHTGTLDKAPLKPGSFGAALVLDRVWQPPEKALADLRPLLAANGRAGLTYPVKVGRSPAPASLERWERRLGNPLPYPAELLAMLARAGFEPQWVETLSDADLDDLYRSMTGDERDEAGLAFSSEISSYRAQAGHSSVSFALVVGRRREPGEKPPATRDRG